MNDFILNADGHEIGTVSINSDPDLTGHSMVTVKIGEVEEYSMMPADQLAPSIRRLIASALSAADEHPKYISLGWPA